MPATTVVVVIVFNLISIERWQREKSESKKNRLVCHTHRQIPNGEPSHEIERVTAMVYVRLSYPNGVEKKFFNQQQQRIRFTNAHPKTDRDRDREREYRINTITLSPNPTHTRTLIHIFIATFWN